VNAPVLQETGPLTFARCETGRLRVQVMGGWVSLLPSGGMLIEAERTLVVADLHLEKGSAYAARGQLLPPYDTRETLARLAADAQAHAPERIVFLGDTLHDMGGHDRIADDDIARLHAIAYGRNLVWVVGNHDPEGPGDLPGESVDTLAIADLVLRHEPQTGDRPGEVAGHLHPCARVIGQSRSVRRRCFVTDGRRLILPAYGAYAGGLSIRDAAFADMFARPPLVGALGSRRVHAVSYQRVRGD
jgi:DNA ligase-associated metallophosphoesterase